MIRQFLGSVLLCLAGVAGLAGLAGSAAQAQEFRAVAHVDPSRSSISLRRTSGALVLSLSQAVPYRVFSLDDPYRLVMDFREVDWQGLAAGDIAPDLPGRVRFGPFRPGWSRLVVDLEAPLAVETAAMETDPETAEAVVTVHLARVDARDYAATTGARSAAPWAPPTALDLPPPVERQRGDRPLVIMLDPGHGGIDPGAQRQGMDESELMLTFARELKDILVREGGMEVYLTRDSDIFVPLAQRVNKARARRADVFLSLHADALARGRATGTVIYTLSETASDAATAELEEREDRSDILAGVDLVAQDDAVASVLIDLARTETTPRSEMLGDHLVSGLRTSLGVMHKRPRLRAGFSVLKAPDIPSALIELGFMSDASDLEQLLDPDWRAEFAYGILLALQSWALEDAAAASLVRQ